MLIYYIGILAFSLIPLSSAQAVEFHVNNEFQASGLYRSYSISDEDGYSEYSDFFAINTLAVNLNSSEWEVEAAPQLRYLTGDSFNNIDPTRRLDIKGPDRLFHLRTRLEQNSTEEVYADFDRLFFQYNLKKIQISVGRRPLSMGILRIFPIWNKFTMTPITSYFTDINFHPDHFSFRYQFRSAAINFYNVEGATDRDRISISHIVLPFKEVELQLLGGVWWQQNVLGFGTFMDINGWSFRTEALTIFSNAKEPAETQAGIGTDVALTSTFTFLLEFFYDSQGATNFEQYQSLIPTRFQSLKGQFYPYSEMKYNFSPSTTVGLGIIFSGIDQTSLAVGNVNWSVNDSIELTGKFFVPLQDSQGEFGWKGQTDEAAFPAKAQMSLSWIF